jgi:hypothetical protein
MAFWQVAREAGCFSVFVFGFGYESEARLALDAACCCCFQLRVSVCFCLSVHVGPLHNTYKLNVIKEIRRKKRQKTGQKSKRQNPMYGRYMPDTALPRYPACPQPRHNPSVYPLENTQDLVPNLQGRNLITPHSLKRTQSQSQGKIILTENGDISQMYTALDHESILEFALPTAWWCCYP